MLILDMISYFFIAGDLSKKKIRQQREVVLPQPTVRGGGLRLCGTGCSLNIVFFSENSRKFASSPRCVESFEAFEANCIAVNFEKTQFFLNSLNRYESFGHGYLMATVTRRRSRISMTGH